jgi:hypothetical protein
MTRLTDLILSVIFMLVVVIIARIVIPSLRFMRERMTLRKPPRCGQACCDSLDTSRQTSVPMVKCDCKGKAS